MGGHRQTHTKYLIYYNFEKIEFWWGGISTAQYLVNEVVRPCDFLTFMHAAGGNNVWQQWGRISANSDLSACVSCCVIHCHKGIAYRWKRVGPFPDW